MKISNNYEQYVENMQKLNMGEDFNNVREPYKEDFEKIYTEAKSNNVTLSNAKEYLNSLSKEELSTLQNFTRLVEEINVNTLDSEGAYNLLLHHYEKFDFNNDGIVSNGISKGISILPSNMPSTEQEAVISALNMMEDKQRFMTMMMLNPPNLKISENGTTITLVENQEQMDYKKIMERINRILNPLPGEKRSQVLLDNFTNFKDLFESKYQEIKSQSEQYHLEQQNNSKIFQAKFSN